MPRARLAVFAAVGVVLVLLGVDALRGGQRAPGGAAPLAGAPALAVEESAAGGRLVVHVAGAVARPGVYALSPGSRVADAIERAGGPDGKADSDGLNLAARLTDGQQVVLPSRAPGAGGATAGPAGESADGPISLGTATAADLEQVDGIGPVTAGKIIEFRDGRGGIGSIDELDEIPGIGPATIEALSARLQP